MLVLNITNNQSINHVLNNYKRNEKNKSGLSDFILIIEMMKKASYRKKIRNKIPDRLLLEQNIVAAYESVEKEDEIACNQEDIDNCRYRRLLLNEIRGHCCGTKRELDFFITHVQKGCLEDPFDDMHVALDPDDQYSDLYCYRGSSSLEITNKQVNKLVHEVSRMSADYCNKKHG